jgi:hypothetical protein
MRDPKMQDRFLNSFKVSYPDFPSLSGSVRNIVINQEMGKHDIAEIVYPLFDKAYFEILKTGVPVEITWKNDKVSGKFLGYTVDVSHTVAQQFERSVKVTCIGSSYPLKERASKMLKMKTILKARTTVVNALNNNPEFALKYLERKKKDEFSLRTEFTGKDGESLAPKNSFTIEIIK